MIDRVLCYSRGEDMKKVLVVPFASKLHGPEYYEGIYASIRKYLERVEGNIAYLPIITSEADIYEYARRQTNMLPFLIALTGGVSDLIRKFILESNSTRAILLCHGEHNSLASAVSARAKLRGSNTRLHIYFCNRFSSSKCRETVERAIRIVKAALTVLNSKILYISPHSKKREEVNIFEKLFEAKADVLSIDELIESLNSARSDYISHFLNVVSSIDFIVPKDELQEVGKLYSSLKYLAEVNNYNGIAIDCFPYLETRHVTPCLALAMLNSEGIVTACEGDISSLLIMMLMRALKGVTGWIANLASIDKNRVYFAHCTVPLNMIKGGFVTTHFESGYPYSLSCKFPGGVYTAVSLNLKEGLVRSFIGRIIRSGLIYSRMCRTQCAIETNILLEDLPNSAIANHHVIVPGDVRNELRDIASVLGLNYIEYKAN